MRSKNITDIYTKFLDLWLDTISNYFEKIEIILEKNLLITKIDANIADKTFIIVLKNYFTKFNIKT